MDAKTFQAMYYAARLLSPKVKVTAAIPMAQSKLEAGANWDSPLAKAANNLFGMKQPVIRKTTSVGPNAKGFAVFTTQYQSIRDFVLFLEQLGMYTDADLYKYIQSGRYTPDSGYLAKVEKIMAQQASQMISPAKVVGVATVAGIGALFGLHLLNKSLS